MDSSDKIRLLSIAKRTIRNKNKIYDIKTECSVELLENKGCFVTLKKNGLLRGCVGYIYPVKELVYAVVENAYNAAFADYRFSPVTSDEVDFIDIEISILTKPKQILFVSKEDLFGKIKPNVDGVIVEYQEKKAVFLPQVWEEIPDVNLFFQNLFVKGRFGNVKFDNCFLKIFLFQVEIINE